jgi:hypothetical protein
MLDTQYSKMMPAYLLLLRMRNWRTPVVIALGILLAVASGAGVSRADASEEPNWKTFIVKANDQFYHIRYWITGGSVIDMVPSEGTSSFTIDISATANGMLTIELPREVIDSRTGEDGRSGDDEEFVAFADEVPADVVEDDAANTASVRQISIDFEQGTGSIEIVGTWRPFLQVSNTWQTTYMVGKFLNSEPPKPDRIFKIQYRIINGTIDDFDLRQEIDDVFIHNWIIAKVNSSNYGILEIKFPRNFPYSNTEGASIEEFIFLAYDGSEYPKDIEDERVTADCFFVFSLPFEGSVKIEMLLASILIKSPYHGDDVPDSCMPQTIVENVPTKKDGTISPLHQFRAGVAPVDVLCPERSPEYVLMISTGKPYCVDPLNVKFLQARGWSGPFE